ncbi:restriction endonuclease [Xanthomonas arboricola]|uniref:restriction endonuclease n=1 Tax=Xanthomonas arboricola TaxID=56448 RepID=UPI000CEE5A6F|nr:restriction endonuclease [Xanthomonas arboricola]PPT30109.1 hypothetical protein XarbCFBP7614_00545 [Xanthomonas arboricola]
MPARTNDFQKLVKVINRRLAGTGVTITESAMLYDPISETNREIDILIEANVVHQPIKIGIECTAVAHALDVRAIESFKEKHRNVGINKTIVVSRRGFTSTAKIYAEKNHIKLLTFGDAKSENWPKTFNRLKGLSIYGRRYFLREIFLEFRTGTKEPDFIVDHNLYVLQAGEKVPLIQFAGKAFQNSGITKHAFNELKANEVNPDPFIQVGFLLDEKFEFFDSTGRLARPHGLTVVMGYKSKYHDLGIQSISYDGRDIAAGGFFDGASNEFAHVAINEVDGELLATVEVSDNFLPNIDETRAPQGD